MPLRLLTAGESHGPALVGILEGLPAGLELGAAHLQKELARRKLGLGRSKRQGLEADRVEVLAGLRHGLTLGSPLAVRIANRDQEDGRAAPLTVPRPGHADLAGARKYGFTDLRDVMERASARETAARTALGAAAKRFLEECGVRVASRVVSILGGVFEVWAEGLPAGLGSYAHWDRRLDGRLAGALMSLNGIKGVDIGWGFASAVPPGSKVLDPYSWKDGGPCYRSNHSGGIDGGMTTGEPLLLRAAMKPLPTLRKPLPSVDLRTGRPAPAPVLRSDVCAVPAAAVIAESLAALVLADALLEKTGGDSMKEILPRLRALRQ